MTRSKRREPHRKPANWGQGKRAAANAPEQSPTVYGWHDEEPIDERITTAAQAAGINPEDLSWHVGAKHGWETHDEGYELALDHAVACALRSVAAGQGARTCPRGEGD